MAGNEAAERYGRTLAVSPLAAPYHRTHSRRGIESRRPDGHAAGARMACLREFTPRHTEGNPIISTWERVAYAKSP